MADICQQLANLLEKDMTEIVKIRKTTEVPPRISVIDVIMVIAEQTIANAGHSFERLSKHHPEILQECGEYTFPGRGQRKTFVTDAQGMVKIIMVLPSRYAARVRQQAALLFVRYLGGDSKLINEVCQMRGMQKELATLSPDSPFRIFGETVEAASLSEDTPTLHDVPTLLHMMESRITQTLREELQRTHPWDFHKNATRYNSLLNIGSIVEGDALMALDEDEHVVSITDFIKARVTAPAWRQHGNKFKNIFAVELKKAKIEECDSYDKPLFIARKQGEYRVIYTEADDELMTNTFHKCKRRFQGIVTRDESFIKAQRKQRRIEDYFTAVDRAMDASDHDPDDEKTVDKPFASVAQASNSCEITVPPQDMDDIALHQDAVPDAPADIRLRAKRGDANVVINGSS